MLEFLRYLVVSEGVQHTQGNQGNQGNQHFKTSNPSWIMRSSITSISIAAEHVEYMCHTKTGVVGNIAETKRWIMGKANKFSSALRHRLPPSVFPCQVPSG